MLDFLRRGVKSWVAKALLALLILSFAVWGIGDIFRTSFDSDILRVGDTTRPASEFAEAIVRQQNLLIRRTQQPVSLADLRAAGIGQQVLNGMVEDATMTEELRARGVLISDAAVRERIMENPTFQDGQGVFNQFTYASTLAQQGINPATFEQATRALVGQTILQRAMGRPLAPLPGMAARIAAFRGETRQIDTVLLTPDLAPDPGEPEATALAEWFTEDAPRFREPDRRWGRFLHLDRQGLMATLAPTPEEVRAEYDRDTDRFTTQPTRTVEKIDFPTEAEARAALDRLTGAEGVLAQTWEAIAAERGVPATDLSLGRLTPGDLPPDTDDAVFALTEPGIAGPVSTGDAAALFYVRQITEGGVAPFETMAPAITEMLARQAVDARIPEIANQIDDLRAGGATLEEIADQVNLPLGTFDGLSRNARLADRSRAQGLIADSTFIAEVFEALDGEERDQVETEDGSYFLVEVDRIEPSYLPELEDVRDRVIAAWQLDQRLETLELRAAAMVEAMAETEIGAQAAEAGLEVNERLPFNRIEPIPDLSDTLVETLFSVPQGGGAFGRAVGGPGVVVGQVRTVTPLDANLMETEIAAFDAQISQALSADAVRFYLRALQERHGAVTYPGTVEQVFESLGQARHGGY